MTDVVFAVAYQMCPPASPGVLPYAPKLSVPMLVGEEHRHFGMHENMPLVNAASAFIGSKMWTMLSVRWCTFLTVARILLRDD